MLLNSMGTILKAVYGGGTRLARWRYICNEKIKQSTKKKHEIQNIKPSILKDQPTNWTSKL